MSGVHHWLLSLPIIELRAACEPSSDHPVHPAMDRSAEQIITLPADCRGAPGATSIALTRRKDSM
ncbi:hypothetical protein [Saccharopolyspora spinosa]|uniref:hypothetical protein n=1 Tax=Saccharopolyspora spinosa TaxID=60894 RepID=UPI003BA984C9